MSSTNMKINIEPMAKSITKAIAYTENGGKPNLASPKKGKTGEMKSIFQFTPATWKNYSKQVYGKDNVPMNANNETYVVHQKVTGWLKKGYTAKQIASMWNAGTGEPDAYTGKFSTGTSSVGVNKKYGVKYNVPQYADKVLKYSQQFYEEQQQPKPNNNTTSMNISGQSQQQGGDPASKLVEIIKQTQANSAQPAQSAGKDGLLSKVLPQTPTT